MASSLKQVIVNAIIKVSQENPALNVEGQDSFEEARNSFIQALLHELFPTDTSAVVIPTASKEKDPVDELTDGIKNLTIEEPKEKKPRKPRAKKAESTEHVNMAKMDTTLSKQLTAIAKEMKVKADKAEVLKYLNSLTPEDYNSKKFEEHVRNFLKPAPVEAKPVVEVAPTELEWAEFEGEEYYVDRKSKRVYVAVGEWKDEKPAGWEPVGYMGMAKFAEMKLED